MTIHVRLRNAEIFKPEDHRTAWIPVFTGMTELSSGAVISSEVCNTHFETVSERRSPPAHERAVTPKYDTALEKCCTKGILYPK
jgi:hypothetical protein